MEEDLLIDDKDISQSDVQTNEETNEQEEIYGSPQEYDYSLIKFPEGMEMDKEMLEKFNPLAKKYNLSNKSATELLNLAVEMQSKNMTKFKDASEKMQEDERNSYLRMLEKDEDLSQKTDAEYGQYISVASYGLKNFATPGFIEVLKAKGLTHHPEFIKTFYAVGKVCQPERLPDVLAPASKPKDIADILYGDN